MNSHAILFHSILLGYSTSTQAGCISYNHYMDPTLQTIKQIVQHNCHVADAGFAADYTLCVYLLKMREFYRWESEQGFDDELERDDIGVWLRQREELWDSLEGEDYKSIPIDSEQFDPFESSLINAALVPMGYAYSGGFGFRKKPHFFLAELEKQIEQDGYQILITNKELARDLTSPPAMTQGQTIYIRRESLRRMVWEKVEQWDWNKLENPMGRAIACYDFNNDLNGSLEDMTNNELDSVLMHEIGEIKAGRSLGTDWEDMIVALPHSKAEIMLRAVRDHLADSLTTLPKLIANSNLASIHFYIGNLNNMRKHLFPELRRAYESDLEDVRQSSEKNSAQQNFSHIEKLITKSAQHWQNLAEQCLGIFAKNEKDWIQQVESLIESNRL
ncbi:MAG: hypothetical protein OEZ33_01830, partial [Gammaproteobacteria bacterium]|nr:hypothetical protein [Gammaproteobacteria bacterium]